MSALRPRIVQGELSTPRFRLLYTARSRGLAEGLREQVEPVRDNFVRQLGRDFPGVVELRVGWGRDELLALADEGAAPPPWAAAYAYPERGVIVLDGLGLVDGKAIPTLRHELAHVALGRLGPGFPRWFHEGLADHLAQDKEASVEHYATLFQATVGGTFYRFEELDAWPAQADRARLAYAQSVAFVSFLVERHGYSALHRLIDLVTQGERFETAFGKAFHGSVFTEEQDWRKTLPRRYGWLPFSAIGTGLWAMGALVLTLGFFRYRRQVTRRRAAQAQLEALEDGLVASPASDDEAPDPSAADDEGRGPWLH